MTKMAGVDFMGRRRILEATRRDERRPRYSERPGYGTAPRARGSAIRASGFWARIDGATAIGGAFRRWEYDWVESEVSDGGWADVEDGRASTEDTRALNGLEAPNAATGVQGNGVNVANLVGTFDLVPIGTGAVVWMWEESDGAGGLRYSFQVANQVDGACE